MVKVAGRVFQWREKKYRFNIYFTESKKNGSKLLVVNGFRFFRNRRRGALQYWKCSNYYKEKCPAIAVYDECSKNLRLTYDHVHNDSQDIVVRRELTEMPGRLICHEVSYMPPLPATHPEPEWRASLTDYAPPPPPPSPTPYPPLLNADDVQSFRLPSMDTIKPQSSATVSLPPTLATINPALPTGLPPGITVSVVHIPQSRTDSAN